MNKDRAIEIFENIRNDDNILHFTHEEHLQAIDYAIEQMGNDNLLERLENGQCKKHITNKIVCYNRDFLYKNLEREVDILKGTKEMLKELRKGASDDEVAEIFSKVVEPYVRSEE